MRRHSEDLERVKWVPGAHSGWGRLKDSHVQDNLGREHAHMLWIRDNLFPLRREVVHTGIKIGFTFSTFELKPFQVWPAPATVAAFTRIHLPTSTVDPICWRFI